MFEDDEPEPRGVDDEASYICTACGEEVVVPVDLTAGSAQEYVEDCPVCCRPHLLRLEIDGQGHLRLDAQAE